MFGSAYEEEGVERNPSGCSRFARLVCSASRDQIYPNPTLAPTSLGSKDITNLVHHCTVLRSCRRCWADRS